jgi:fatty-acyl-CoA synthase
MIGPMTLSQSLARQVADRAAAEAFVAPGERHTWAALQDGAQRIARGLHAAGVRRGDHVGVLLGNGGTWVQVFYACAMLGAVTVPVNTRFKTDELAFCLRQADVKLLLTADSFLGIDFLGLLTQVEPALDSGLPGEALPLLRRVVVLGSSCS